jgi:transposase
MSEMFNPHAPATAYDHNTTIVAVLELSGKNWLLGAVAPGLSRRMKRSLEARNVEAVVRALEQAKGASAKAHLEVTRIVVGFESGRDGFWIARALQQRGLEVYVMHAASIAVERRGKRAKTDRLDVDLLLTTLMGWNLGAARWRRFRAKKRKTCARLVAAGKRWSTPGSRWRTRSPAFSSGTGSKASNRG